MNEELSSIHAENDSTDKLYSSVYRGSEEISFQSLEAGNDPLSIYKQVSSLNDSFEERDQSLNLQYPNFDMDKKSINKTLEDLSLFNPFPNTQEKPVEVKSSLVSPKIVPEDRSNDGNPNPNMSKPSSNLRTTTSVSGLFSFANTVTQNISSQIQNALRETTSNIIVSNGTSHKVQDPSRWSKILSKIYQNKGPVSNSSLEICEADAENITKNMNISLFPGEKLVLFNKECGISAQGLADPIFGSLIMTNFRIILAPLFQKNAKNRALTIIKRFLVSWMYKSGFLHIPINSIIHVGVSSVAGNNEQNGACQEGNISNVAPGQYIGNNLNLVGSLGAIGGGPGICQNNQSNVNSKSCTYTLDISTKDLRSIQVLVMSSEQDKKLTQSIIQNTLNETLPRNLFSYIFKENFESLPLFPSLNGIFEFDIFKEYSRQGVPISGDLSNGNVSRFPLRFTNVNQNFELCSSYPRILVVPESISDSQLIKVAAFRSKGRIPILSWTNPDLKCTLWRSSQPKSAFKRCIEDEIMITTLSSFYKNNGDPQEERPFSILDARPKLNAFANKATGAGFENIDYYKHCKLEFLNIENIHKVRDSWNKMALVIQKFSSQDLPVVNPNFDKAIDLLNQENITSAQAQSVLSSLNRMNNSENLVGLKLISEIDSTGWYDLISMILASSNKIVDQLIREKGVLVHCSDGWDRTSQLIALAMLCIDPYYRTIKGFLSLIEKEFILSGHKFHSRSGTPGKGSCLDKESERSPIFIQWLDCVYQCYTQFPTEFQFHPNLLIIIADHLNNGLFGNFHCDNEYERSSIHSRDLTVSLWDAIIYSIQNKSKENLESGQSEPLLSLSSCAIFHKELINPFYNPTHTKIKTHADVLILDSSSFGIAPWMPFWFRFTPINSKTVSNPLLYSNC
ncbi:myotubularin related protein [Cryptosporidium ubiquitum]|uniref:Myotubularin related protein n=1 Tax=Cryptosporidium ubiquitum TaxID=857276 RepID=A0A1J4MG98_9CRYT|nr:myotubularin related protein [Cryptosporidium ubiquitum]OII73254.1 myotubularin related protein [Cryptosporidium ubiquitum]